METKIDEVRTSRSTKESGINEELEQIQLTSGEENDKVCRMQGKKIPQFIVESRIQAQDDQSDWRMTWHQNEMHLPQQSGNASPRLFRPSQI
jgi:hypothetical protein